MSTEATALDMSGARKVYQLLEELESHLNEKDTSGRAMLYKAKERLRKLIIDMDRFGSGEHSRS